MSAKFRTEPSARFPCGVACRLIHLNAGWRYWVFDRATSEEAPHFSPDGYATEEAARAAVAAAEGFA